jgi:hypothetical protein
VSTLLKRFLSFSLKTDLDFWILPLTGGNQSIVWPNRVPTLKEGIDLYFQHKTVKDGVRRKINVTMKKLFGLMKEMHSAFRTYLTKEKVYASQAALGLGEACLIGVFLQADLNRTFRDDLKEAITDVMAD